MIVAHGHLAAKLALQLSDGFRKRVALTELADKHYDKLKASRYGRVLIAYVRKCMVEDRPIRSYRNDRALWEESVFLSKVARQPCFKRCTTL